MKPESKNIFKVNGFTLIELILVMIILTTVLAIASPTLKGFFSSRKINDAAEQIIAITRYARTNAIYSSNYYRLNFDLSERKYWISVLKESEYVRLDNDLGRSFIMSSEIEFKFENLARDSSVYYLEYDPQGYCRESKIIMEDKNENIIELACKSPAENFVLVEVYNEHNN
jgi:prepilin-type N-terminal cleavage/methylation domain-containing protein